MGVVDQPFSALRLAPQADRAFPSAHVVQFYEQDAFLLDTVSHLIGRALEAGDVAVAVTTQEHHAGLSERLSARGLDIPALLERGQYVWLDAVETLSRFMVDGRPHRARFTAVVGGAISRALEAGHSAHVQVFGEMVALLYAQGNHAGAVRLEELWNELAKKLRFSLVCAYPIRAFRAPSDDQPFAKICSAHSEIIPCESYAAVSDPLERSRAIAELQRKASALAVETEQRKEAQKSLHRMLRVAEQARAEAEAANRTKDEFLAMLGHELRNPLSAVRNAILTARLDGARRERALDIAQRQTELLCSLVDDLLDVARITQGKITLRKERVVLSDLVRRTVDGVRSLIDDRGQTLSASVPDAQLAVNADPGRLEQVLMNLLTNASKYSPPGGAISIRCEREDNQVAIRVRDNGSGIAPDMLPRVFDLFAQADRSLDRVQGGLGVGLTVVKRLVELHGGNVVAHSEGPGKGSEFTVRVPALTQDEAPRNRCSDQQPAARVRARVLVVEDNADSAESLMMLLELLGHQVRVACDGATALELARANAPDVMLVDIGLPGIDGYEVARRVRLDPALRSVVLVALTGYGQDEDKREALAAGFDKHLVKPIDPDALRGLVGQIGASASTDRFAGSV